MRRRRSAAVPTTPGTLRGRADRSAGWDNVLLPWRHTLGPPWREYRGPACQRRVGKVRVQRTRGAFLLDQGIDDGAASFLADRAQCALQRGLDLGYSAHAFGMRATRRRRDAGVIGRLRKVDVDAG